MDGCTEYDGWLLAGRSFVLVFEGSTWRCLPMRLKTIKRAAERIEMGFKLPGSRCWKECSWLLYTESSRTWSSRHTWRE
jgi:hypothetical protein